MTANAPKARTTPQCERCRTRPTRYYFNGWLCTRCAPSEAQILHHAVMRAHITDQLRNTTTTR